MDEKYEIAAADACSIAQELELLGVQVRVVDIRQTFRNRWSRPDAPEVLLWPKGEGR